MSKTASLTISNDALAAAYDVALDSRSRHLDRAPRTTC